MVARKGGDTNIMLVRCAVDHYICSHDRYYEIQKYRNTGHPISLSSESRTSAKADLPPPPGGTAPCPASCPPAPGLAPSSNLGTSIVAKLGEFTNHLFVNCSTCLEMYLNTVMSKTLRCILMKTCHVLHHSCKNLQFRGVYQ